MSEPEVMSGGVNEVVRIGDAVRRPTGPWSPLVHGLLRHLRDQGFAAAPALRELTEDGFEVLDFLPGDVSNYPVTPAAASLEALETAAELLRAYHDCTIGYAVGVTDGWMLPARTPAEVICHGDYAPHNCVLNGDRVVGIIDFDTAHPAPRIWDIGYAVYRWAPITAPANADGFGSIDEQARRTRIFCDRYGLDTPGRAGLIDVVIARLHALVAYMRARAAAGNAAFAGHLEEGHHLQYLADAEYVDRQREIFDRYLLPDASDEQDDGVPRSLPQNPPGRDQTGREHCVDG
jgi:Phosphotransferase enzyme family